MRSWLLSSRYRWAAASTAALLAALATVILVSSPGAPIYGQSCAVTAKAAFQENRPKPSARPPVQDPEQVTSDAAAVAAAQQTLDDLATEQQTVDAAQAAAKKASDAASNAEDQLTQLDDYTLQSDVSSAQADVSMAQTAVDGDNSMISSDQSTLDSLSGDGLDTSFEQQMLDDEKSTLATDEQKLADAKSALATAQSKADGAAATRQQEQQQADSLTQRATELQNKADAAAQDLADKQSSAQQTLDSAQKTQSDDRDTFQSTLAIWTHLNRLRLADAAAVNAETGDCRSAAQRSLGVAIGLFALASALAIAAAFDGRSLTVPGWLSPVGRAARPLTRRVSGAVRWIARWRV